MVSRRKRFTNRSRGFTLIEVLMVVVVLGILGTVALRSVQNAIDGSRFRETQTEMDEIAFAIAGNPSLYANGLRSDFGYVGDVGAVPTTLDNLVTNPGGYTTWNGPYVTRRFTQDPDGFKKDAWGNAYTFASGITITSTGGGSTTLTKSVASTSSDLTSTPVIGTITDAAGNPPGDSAVAVTVKVTYPNGTGGTTSASIHPGTGGAFSFAGIPIGIRTVQAIYRATNDTVFALASVLPRDGAAVALRLPRSPFASAGGGGGSSSLQYVAGSAHGENGCEDVSFDIINTSGSSVTVSSLTATYSHSPAAYFGQVTWAGNTVFNNTNPRAGSGTLVTFSSSQTIGAGATATVKLRGFRDAPTGGNDLNMNNTSFTVTFSNGSSVTFTVSTCTGG